ncbi:MAG: hypothetical protein K8H86_12055, partial [Ignavibacteriaceae bacterium]|nr:hypothetical protein [Ignavibacteriaceae bacterium]
LIGNVIAKQDSLTITTPEGFYYGDERIAQSDKGVYLDDQKVILTAKTGEYNFNENRAHFLVDVLLYDTTTTLTSNELIYYKEENRAVAVGNVKIIDSTNTITADSLEHFRQSRITFADQNVKLQSSKNNVEIYGNHLEDYPHKLYSVVTENSLLIQIDTSYVVTRDTLENGIIDSVRTAKLDTLVISCMVMEAHRDTSNIFFAKDSVEIVRGEFASKNDFTTYFRTEEKIITKKRNREAHQPIIWFDASQLTGDSVAIYLENNTIKELDVIKNGFILSQNEIFKSRFDQISGDSLYIHFDDEGIDLTEVFGGVLSIYYLYDNNEPNGLMKSSSQTTKIKFDEKKVNQVRLYGQPTSEYYPEPQVAGKELSFTLPRYMFYENRPQKEKLLEAIIINQIKKEDGLNGQINTEE